VRLTTIHILFALFLTSCFNGDRSGEKHDLTKDSLTLTKMVHERESAMKTKNIPAVMAQFSDDATFINGDGYYLANKKEIEEFHKALTRGDSISYYYIAGKVLVRMLDDNNALVYYPNRMDWYRVSKPKDTIEKEIRLLTLSAQKRKGKWQWIAITNQQTIEYFDDLSKHKISDLDEYLKDTTQNK
jgi:uncharacterized protein (TIGR02246 family)